MTSYVQPTLVFGDDPDNRAPSEKPATHDETRASVDAVKAHMAEAAEVGAAFTRIRDRGSYRQTHPTFELYAADRWGLTGDDLELILSIVGETS